MGIDPITGVATNLWQFPSDMATLASLQYSFNVAENILYVLGTTLGTGYSWNQRIYALDLSGSGTSSDLGPAPSNIGAESNFRQNGGAMDSWNGNDGIF